MSLPEVECSNIRTKVIESVLRRRIRELVSERQSTNFVLTCLRREIGIGFFTRTRLRVLLSL